MRSTPPWLDTEVYSDTYREREEDMAVIEICVSVHSKERGSDSCWRLVIRCALEVIDSNHLAPSESKGCVSRNLSAEQVDSGARVRTIDRETGARRKHQRSTGIESNIRPACLSHNSVISNISHVEELVHVRTVGRNNLSNRGWTRAKAAPVQSATFTSDLTDCDKQ